MKALLRPIKKLCCNRSKIYLTLSGVLVLLVLAHSLTGDKHAFEAIPGAFLILTGALGYAAWPWFKKQWDQCDVEEEGEGE
jgi:hypothetical protein